MDRKPAWGRGNKGVGPGQQGPGKNIQRMPVERGEPRGPSWGRGGEGDEPVPRQMQQTGMRQPAPPPVPRHAAPVSNPLLKQGEQIKVSSEATRGAVRGRRVISEVIKTRPANLDSKKGVTGKEVALQTNYFALSNKPTWVLYRFRIDFAPVVEFMGLRKKLVGQHKIFGSYIFDGEQLFSTNPVGEMNSDKPLELLSKDNEGNAYKITVKFTGKIDKYDYEYLQILNLILRRSMEGLKLELIGRNYFDPDPKCKINLSDHKLQLWPGYKTSIRQHEQHILLCAELAYKVMRTDTLFDILNDCRKNSRNARDAYKKEVVGMIVLTTYKNKTYRVDDVDWGLTPASTFETKSGNVSYLDYYKNSYNIKIRYNDQPLLVSKPTERNRRGGVNEFIMLIPELCVATGINDAMRNNFHLMKAMSEHTRLVPEERIKRLIQFNKRLTSVPESMEYLKSWNLSLDPTLVDVKGRTLPCERIIFGDNKRIQSNKEADWTSEFRGKTKMFSIVNLHRWFVLTPKRNSKETFEFIRFVIQAANGMGMEIKEPRQCLLEDDRNSSYSNAIEQCAKQDPQLMFLTVPNNNLERYSSIKKKLCIDRPTPSQVVISRTMIPKRGKPPSSLLSIATKVAIQLNCKLMGAPWMIEMPLKGLMAVGFDVCHSAMDASKSYGALVASMDLKLSSRFYSTISQHNKGQELSNDVSMMMHKALNEYRNIHNCLPERIVFYRDGVGEGQLHQVYSTEVQNLKKRLDEIYTTAMGQETKARFAFIVVNKTINTRYFLNHNNPPSGTVVDDVITLPERYDFFLISQSVQQGSVSPTNYNVIYDNIGLNADKIQMLTYKLTHLYYNITATLRVPAMCQYAHKLAFLVAQSLHRAPSNLLEKQLYYL